MCISGSKSVKKSQKFPKKATNWTHSAFSKHFFGLANLNIKKLVLLYDFMNYFFPRVIFEFTLNSYQQLYKMKSEFFHHLA